ncbi:hypothetical protein [Aquibacillus saliphilus]|nr:hypothetical protein [Aquibacillus saliphilus]
MDINTWSILFINKFKLAATTTINDQTLVPITVDHDLHGRTVS